jgi:hypothetical protein
MKKFYKELIVIGILILIAIQFYKLQIMKKNIPTDILLTKLKFNWKELPYAESKYTEFAVLLLEKFSKNMNRETRVQYIRENWRISQALSLNSFSGFAIDYLETGLNPDGKHDYGEVGISGIKYNTALFALTIQKNFMPTHLKRYVYVDLRNKEQLKDPIISMKLKYTLLWWYRIQYGNMENWMVSVYHWGNHVGKHFKTKKEIPIRFTLDGINYNVLKYYVAYKEILIAFNSGKLEPAVESRNRWKAEYKRQCKEEITFQNCYRIIKRLQRQIKEKENKELAYIQSDEKLKIELEKSKKEMIKISGQAKNGEGKTALRKVKNIAHKLLKKLGV